jgi:hypothetical protein
MKNINIPALALCLTALVATAPETQAGPFQRDRSEGKGKRTEKTVDQQRPRRLNHIPEMTFTRGRLVRDGLSGWRVDGMVMTVRRDCVMMEDGAAISVLEEGHDVLVTGAWRDGALEAWGVEVLAATDGVAISNGQREIAVSDSDPTVGEILSSPY